MPGVSLATVSVQTALRKGAVLNRASCRGIDRNPRQCHKEVDPIISYNHLVGIGRNLFHQFVGCPSVETGSKVLNFEKAASPWTRWKNAQHWEAHNASAIGQNKQIENKSNKPLTAAKILFLQVQILNFQCLRNHLKFSNIWFVQNHHKSVACQEQQRMDQKPWWPNLRSRTVSTTILRKCQEIKKKRTTTKVLKSAKIHQNPTISPWNHQNSTQQTHPRLRHGVLQAALFGLRHCVAQPRPSNHNKRNWKSPTYRNWSGEKKQVWNFLHAFWASLASSTSFSSWPLPLLTWIGTRIQSLRQTLAINTGASHVLVYDGRTNDPFQSCAIY